MTYQRCNDFREQYTDIIKGIQKNPDEYILRAADRAYADSRYQYICYSDIYIHLIPDCSLQASSSRYIFLKSLISLKKIRRIMLQNGWVVINGKNIYTKFRKVSK